MKFFLANVFCILLRSRVESGSCSSQSQPIAVAVPLYQMGGYNNNQPANVNNNQEETDAKIKNLTGFY